MAHCSRILRLHDILHPPNPDFECVYTGWIGRSQSRDRSLVHHTSAQSLGVPDFSLATTMDSAPDLQL
jgi:hypothetical protein